MSRGRLRAIGVTTVIVCALVVVLVALAAEGARAAATIPVSIQSGAFNPSLVTINVGDTVTWTNTDSITHTTTPNTGLWDSGFVAPGESFSHTFTQAGTFDYRCTIHGFTGRVVVVAASTTTTATSTTTTATSTTTTSTSSTTTTTLAGTSAFVDVPPGSAFFTAIEGLAGAGIIGGYDRPDGHKEFRPQNDVLRAQFAKIIVGALGIPVVPNAPTPFTDVARDASGYPADYVAAAYQNNITQGRTATLFAPYVSVTRAQVTTLVVRALQQLHPGLLQDPPASYQNTWGTTFSDIHGPLARIAEFNGLLGGLPLTTTSAEPLGAMSRGEVAQVPWNMMQLIGP
jgi:plastocyanin